MSENITATEIIIHFTPLILTFYIWVSLWYFYDPVLFKCKNKSTKKVNGILMSRETWSQYVFCYHWHINKFIMQNLKQSADYDRDNEEASDSDDRW